MNKLHVLSNKIGYEVKKIKTMYGHENEIIELNDLYVLGLNHDCICDDDNNLVFYRNDNPETIFQTKEFIEMIKYLEKLSDLNII